MTGARALARWGIALPLALAVAGYARILGAEFQYDDFHALVQNPVVKDLPRFLDEAFWQGWARGGRPLTDLSFALQYRLTGLDPVPLHAVNLALHLATTLLVLALARACVRLAGHPGELLPVAVAGLFAVHPLHTEAVSYVVQRSEVLASALALATVLLLLAADRARGGAGRALLVAGACATFLAAMGAKAVAVTAPAAYLLVANALPPADREARVARLRRTLLHAAPVLALAALCALRTVRGLSGDSTAGFGVVGLQGSYPAAQLVAIPTYVRLLAWPAGQNVDHELAPVAGLSDPRALAGAAFLLALAGGAALLWIRGARATGLGPARARLAACGIAFFLLALAPSSSFVPLVDLVVEHRVYLASFGALLASCVAADALLAGMGTERRAQAGVALAAASMLALYAALFVRNGLWETRLSLWSDAAARSPGKARAQMNHAQALAEDGQLAPAIATYRRALALPDPRAPTVEILANLGLLLFRSGERAEAAALLERAVGLSEDPRLLVNLANVRLAEGRAADAETLARRAVARGRNLDATHATLALALSARGDHEAALGALRTAMRLEPEDPRHAFNAGAELAALHRSDEACAAYRQATALARDAELRDRARESLQRLGCP